ncbi:hypothetical protein CPT03_16975 [Pedobacter ginsengisoli]|uniref:Uncharacterized protein n=1 Tax=Pedobacter ginsengisoli TaxID=363852 RepID=A0A2D1U8V0_9SPHI|nr:hypothetical protein [Pedobacter ginsengisoli]ATP58038.1 hypothetical protein CPT03_16975 [Pedobacter ginsengisoli]
MGYSRAGAVSLNYYSSGWTGGTKAMIKTIKIAKIARIMGVAGFAAGEIMDGIALYQGKIGWGKASVNLAMGIVGFSEAAPLSVMYFGIDAFYPGGISGFGKDLSNFRRNLKVLQCKLSISCSMVEGLGNN